jgi:hypothetical protein
MSNLIDATEKLQLEMSVFERREEFHSPVVNSLDKGKVRIACFRAGGGQKA